MTDPTPAGPPVRIPGAALASLRAKVAEQLADCRPTLAAEVGPDFAARIIDEPATIEAAVGLYLDIKTEAEEVALSAARYLRDHPGETAVDALVRACNELTRSDR